MVTQVLDIIIMCIVINFINSIVQATDVLKFDSVGIHVQD